MFRSFPATAESSLRRSMVLSRGDPSIFFTRPLSLTLLVLAAGLLLLVVLPQISAARAKVFQE
jgi:TctA family transporter